MRILPHWVAARRTLAMLAILPILSLATACSDNTQPDAITGPDAPSVQGDLQSAFGSGTSTAIVSQLAANTCLDVRLASTASGTPVEIWGCNGGSNQKFTWQSNGEIRVYGNMCLDASGGQGNDGDPIIIWPCSGAANQKWTPTAAGEIKGINGKCMDVKYADPTPGSRVILWPCNGQRNQKWDVSGSSGSGSTTPPSSDSSSTDTSSGSSGGTTTPPAGAVTLRPGADIQAAVNSHGGGTAFYLEAGTYARQSITPKSGDKFIGASGATLDGQHATTYAFQGSADNVTIQGLIIQNYNPPAQMGAVKAGGNSASDGTSGWVVEDNEIRYNATAGIRLGTQMKVLRNKVHHNGQEGIVGIGDNVLVEGNEIAFNNYQDAYNPGWEAGGTKFVHTNNLVVRNNYVHDNHGPGLWTDIDNYNTLYEGNRVENNTQMGIFHEISWKATIRNNTVSGNGFKMNSWLWGAGILVAASKDVEIYGNTVKNNANGITAVQQNRGSGTYGTHLVQNLNVHDNSVTVSSGGRSGIAQDIGNNAVFTSWNNHFHHNTYYIGGNSHPFEWMNQQIGKSQWQGYGQDTDGTFN
ncbi:MAG TPA: lectin [Gemmatimonadaceae bacterium]